MVFFFLVQKREKTPLRSLNNVHLLHESNINHFSIRKPTHSATRSKKSHVWKKPVQKIQQNNNNYNIVQLFLCQNRGRKRRSVHLKRSKFDESDIQRAGLLSTTKQGAQEEHGTKINLDSGLGCRILQQIPIRQLFHLGEFNCQ